MWWEIYGHALHKVISQNEMPCGKVITYFWMVKWVWTELGISEQCMYTSKGQTLNPKPTFGPFVMRIDIVIQHTSLTYHTHIHTQTHNMDESIHKYMCTTTYSSLSENDTRKIYYHKTRDANTYSQVKRTPLREFKLMLTRHHSSKLH